MCLCVEHAQASVKGAGSVHCENFSLRELHSYLALILRGEESATLPRGLGPTSTDVTWHLRSVIEVEQVDLMEELEQMCNTVSFVSSCLIRKFSGNFFGSAWRISSPHI